MDATPRPPPPELLTSPLYLLAVLQSARVSGDAVLERYVRRRLVGMGVSVVFTPSDTPADPDTTGATSDATPHPATPPTTERHAHLMSCDDPLVSDWGRRRGRRPAAGDHHDHRYRHSRGPTVTTDPTPYTLPVPGDADPTDVALGAGMLTTWLVAVAGTDPDPAVRATARRALLGVCRCIIDRAFDPPTDDDANDDDTTDDPPWRAHELN